MDKKEILKNNGIIADYMGAEIKGDSFRFSLGNPSDYLQIEQIDFKPFKCLHYHESWSQLMPVWHKLRKELDYDDLVTRTYYESIVFALNHYDILNVFNRIVKAIEWKNKQTTNQTKNQTQ